MLETNSRIILLLAGICFFSNSFASAEITEDEQNVQYQKEADKYKKLYEKYQKLADKANKDKVVKKFVEASKEKPKDEKNLVTKPAEKDIPSSKDLKKDEKILEPWKGTNFGFGGTIATGDSATTNVNALANVSYQPMEKWKNKFFLNYVYSRDDRRESRAVKINKAQIRAETSWDFTKINAAYGRMTYLNDELSTYDYIFTESVGYKRRVYENESKNMYIDLSAGPSLMQSRITNTQLTANAPGFQATFDYVWNFTDKSNYSTPINQTIFSII